jgi:hypothetical protein
LVSQSIAFKSKVYYFKAAAAALKMCSHPTFSAARKSSSSRNGCGEAVLAHSIQETDHSHKFSTLYHHRMKNNIMPPYFRIQSAAAAAREPSKKLR